MGVMLLIETSDSCTLEDINKAAESLGLRDHMLQEIKQELDSFDDIPSIDPYVSNEESNETININSVKTEYCIVLYCIVIIY